MTQTGTTSVQVSCNIMLHIASLPGAESMVLAVGMSRGQASFKQ